MTQHRGLGGQKWWKENGEMKCYNRQGINREFMKEYDGIDGRIQEQWKRNKQRNNTIVRK